VLADDESIVERNGQIYTMESVSYYPDPQEYIKYRKGYTPEYIEKLKDYCQCDIHTKFILPYYSGCLRMRETMHIFCIGDYVFPNERVVTKTEKYMNEGGKKVYDSNIFVKFHNTYGGIKFWAIISVLLGGVITLYKYTR
jgi:hypothetical protein